jgi:hypothetical protein
LDANRTNGTVTTSPGDIIITAHDQTIWLYASIVKAGSGPHRLVGHVNGINSRPSGHAFTILGVVNNWSVIFVYALHHETQNLGWFITNGKLIKKIFNANVE